jgi:hypothetical protein
MALTSGGGQPGLDVGGQSTDAVFVGNIAKDNYRNWSITGGGLGHIAVANRSLGSPVAVDSLSGLDTIDLAAGITRLAGGLTVAGTTTLGTLLTSGVLWSTLASSNSVAYRTRASGDTQDRFQFRASGSMYWGDGTAVTPDVNLYRAAADLLSMGTGDSLRLDGTWNGGKVQLGNYRLWVDATGVLRIKNGAPTSDTDGTVVGTQA